MFVEIALPVDKYLFKVINENTNVYWLLLRISKVNNKDTATILNDFVMLSTHAAP